MIVYKIDKQSHGKISSQVKDMEAVLKEIAPTLQMLSQMLAEQQGTISSPSIDAYRADLHRRVNEAVNATSRIADDTQRLIAVSEQAGKHLAAIEEHFASSLRTAPQVRNDMQLVP